MKCGRLIFSGHALRRMFERNIGKDEVVAAVADGEVILEYPEDQPYPSVLILALTESVPLHVLVARDEQDICYIVTSYRPDASLWQNDFKKRRNTP